MTSKTRPPGLVRLASLLVDVWPSLLVALGAVVVGLPGLADSRGRVDIPTHPSQGLVLAVGAALTLVGVVEGTRRQQRLSALRERLGATTSELGRSREALEHLARVELDLLGDELQYGSSERLSLFACTGQQFELLARQSVNPNYCDGGRRPYPLNCGCLSTAWNHVRAFLVVPERRHQDETTWISAHVASGVPRELAADFRMGSRTVIALRIDDPRVGRRPLGVLVLESEQTSMDQGAFGPPRAVLEPEEAFVLVARQSRRLAGVLSVFAELPGSAPRL